jgi:hypothetical protein
MISQRAVDLIIGYEVTSRAHYERALRHPEWPGGASGITVAIGYDLGYASRDKLFADWAGRVPPMMIVVMQRCLSVRGEAAHKMLGSVRADIDIPWDDAVAVFLERDVPEWTARVCAAIPNADRLTPDCLGAIVSIAYNRGASFNASGDRYAEMRAIKQHIGAGELSKVPGDIRAMKRLWPDVAGLRIRRDAEADLFQSGLQSQSVPVVAPKPPLPPVDDMRSKVARLQQALYAAGFDPHGIDGRLGPNTVKAFQRSRGFTGADVDGIAGAKTSPLLEAALAEI